MRRLWKVLKVLFVIILIAALLVVCIYGYARYIEPYRIQVVRETMEVPDDIGECRIVFFSDTHFGRWYSVDQIDEIARVINEQNPDVVLFGGDLIDDYNRDEEDLDVDKIIEGLKSIKATYGKYAVFGNHDYGGGAQYVFEDILDQSGFRLLVNERAYIKALNLKITGFDDSIFGYTRDEAYELEGFRIIVAHEPDQADKVDDEDDTLMLTGHSHGGQVYLPFMLDYFLPDGVTEYIRGWYPSLGVNENVHLYVTRGIGMTGIPFRFMSVPELTVIDLVHASK